MSRTSTLSMASRKKSPPSPASASRRPTGSTPKPIGLQAELRQTKSFPSLHAEAFLNVVRTSAQLQHALHLKLKPYSITETQYNSLRILRGAGSMGLTCAEIAERLVSQDPDITRLVERLQRQGLVRRERGEKDRRVVLTKITARGTRSTKRIGSCGRRHGACPAVPSFIIGVENDDRPVGKGPAIRRALDSKQLAMQSRAEADPC